MHCGEHDGFAHGAMLLKVMLSRLWSGVGDQLSFCSLLSMVLLHSTFGMGPCTAACATLEGIHALSCPQLPGREQTKQDCLHQRPTPGVMEKAAISLALLSLAPCCSFRLVPS